MIIFYINLEQSYEIYELFLKYALKGFNMFYLVLGKTFCLSFLEIILSTKVLNGYRLFLHEFITIYILITIHFLRVFSIIPIAFYIIFYIFSFMILLFISYPSLISSANPSNNLTFNVSLTFSKML
jgi:hypothetical protein